MEQNFISLFLLLLFILLTPNAIHALLALILIFINFSILLFIFDTSFLAFSYILVYIGAICVLFLYIILLLHLRTYTILQKVNLMLLISIIIGFIAIFIYINYNTESSVITTTLYNNFLLSDLYLFTSYLFITHQLYMLFGIFLLLLALFLSIFLSTIFLSQHQQQEIKFIINE